MTYRTSLAPLALASCLALGCSSANPPDDGSGPADSAAEAASDTPSPPADAAPDASGGDADAGGGPDAAPDAPGGDAGTDASPDAAGPVSHDLARMYTRGTIEVALFGGREYTRVTAPMACSIAAGGTLNFSARVCGTGTTCVTVTGDAPPGSDGGGAGVTVTYATGQANSAIDVHVARGARYSDAMGTLQNFHVTFAAGAMGSVPAVTGIAGTTVSPDYADAWLLGCPQL